MNIKLIAVACVALNISACATVTKGTNFDVAVSSAPSDAKVTFVNTENKYQGGTCVTPCFVKLNRKGTYKTTVEKAGYDSYEVMVFPKVSKSCLLYTSPSPRDATLSRMPSSA